MMLNDQVKKDFLSSIVVLLVAIPLCIGIANASGLPAMTGLISGIIGGIVVGFFSGCSLQVSGPAAGLIVLVIEAIQNYGIKAFGVIVFLAGIIQILIGVLKLASWFRAVSPAIIQGMLSGIGVLILSSQFHVMLDHIPSKKPLQDLLAIPATLYNGIFPVDGSSHHLAAGIGILTIAILVSWKFMPKKIRIIPPALVAVLVPIFVSALFRMPIKYISISENIFECINLLAFGTLSSFMNIDIFLEAIAFALIASVATLLSANAVDRMAKSSMTNYNKEILAQGLGNSLAGILGALPLAGVIVRSTVNIEAGAQTRLSAILHGFWILLLITLCPFILGYIPGACLAALLVYTGYKLINPQAAKSIYNLSKGEFLVFIITVIAIVMTNLLQGIIIGLVLSIAKNLYRLSIFGVNVVHEKSSDKITIKIKGNLTFLRLPQIANIIENIKPGGEVYVVFEHTSLIDHSIIDLLSGWSSRYIELGGNVFIDWDYVKMLYPDFGWDACNSISDNIARTTIRK